MTILGRIMRPQIRLMELSNLNMMHQENNYCAVMMIISVLNTDSKERGAMEYVRCKDFACVGAIIGGVFQNTK